MSNEELGSLDGPGRKIRLMVGTVSSEVDPIFGEMYISGGPNRVPQQMFFKLTVLTDLYSDRFGRAFFVRLNCDLLVMWFSDVRINQRKSP